MSKFLWAGLAMLVSSSVFAGTEHYVGRDGNHVHHLKISEVGGEINVSVDVDFEPNGPAEEGRKPCSADIAGETKRTGPNTLILKKQAEGEAHYCSLTITTTSEGATVDQSADCKYFVAGICHFDSDGRELKQVR
ncbi:hypothetical protein FJZ55_05470 [Candidatus Woesearchaeota archaeon]|nr:hypothetical protein [Candidatus Woesearchaeota archaeon]